MSITLLNTKYPIVTQRTNTVNVTINAGAALYLALPSLNSKPGYVMIGAIVETSGMSNYAALIPSQLQSSGNSAWVRVLNSGSQQSTGTMYATVRWARG